MAEASLDHVLWKCFVWILLVNVVSCAVILEGPSNETINLGVVAKLKCRTSSNVTVDWYQGTFVKHLINLTLPSHKMFYSIDINNTLAISNVSLTSASYLSTTYECVAKNATRELERSPPATLFIRYLNLKQATVEPVSLYVGDTHQDMSISWISYPATQSVSWQLPDAISMDRNITTNNSSQSYNDTLYFGRAWMSLTGIDSSEFSGNYSLVVRTGYETKTVVVAILNVEDECKSSRLWKCPNTRKCIYTDQHCNNLDDCGDYSDETINCSLPLAPSLYGTNVRWNSVAVRYSYPLRMRSIRNVTVLVEFFKEGVLLDQYQVMMDYARYSNVEKWGNLTNGTTYMVKMRTKLHIGMSVNTSVVNVTIPRMVAPGSPRNLSASAKALFSSIWVIFRYSRPEDDGGTVALVGILVTCTFDEVTRTKKDCKDNLIFLGNRMYSERTFYSMEPETKYYFSLSFKSQANQYGPSASLNFTTPPKRKSEYDLTSSGLSSGAIAGIVISSLSVFTAILSCLFKTFLRSANSSGVSVAYTPNNDGIE